MKDSDFSRIQKRKAVYKELSELIGSISEDNGPVERLTRDLVKEYSSDLDTLSDRMDVMLTRIKSGSIKNYDSLSLEIQILELANGMYKAADGLAILSGRSDASKQERERRHSEIYATLETGTIQDKKARVLQDIQMEVTIEKIFDGSYTSLLRKVKYANRLLEAMKKIISSRMVTREVFRKEASVYDELIQEDMRELMTEENTGDINDE